MSSISEGIQRRVFELYERNPYPAYPLLLPLRWQDAYLASPEFARSLASLHGFVTSASPQPRMLIAGCGDTLPYLIRKLEPRYWHLTAWDLSPRTIRRARLRLWANTKPVTWNACDLIEAAQYARESFDHIDCYGVLHHLAEPRRGLAALTSCLKPGGTLRLMVYNPASRHWIHHLQKLFSWLKLDPSQAADRRWSQQFLAAVSREIPALQPRLKPMLKGLKANPARLVDTFFQARECRLTGHDWQSIFAANHLHVTGLFDRYAELDDLPNPLWQPPTIDQLAERWRDGRFENNFEWYLIKPRGQEDKRLTRPAKSAVSSFQLPARWHGPPRLWADFAETRALSPPTLQRLWWAYLSTLYRGKSRPLDAWLKSMPWSTLQRLARVGAIHKSQLQSAELQEIGLQPRHQHMEPPDYSPVQEPGPQLRQLVESLIHSRKLSPRLLPQVWRRLQRAQEGHG